MEYNMEYAMARYARIAAAMGKKYDNVEDGARKALQAVRGLSDYLRLPSLVQLGVVEEDFDELARASARNSSSESNPRPMGRPEYGEVIRRLWKAGASKDNGDADMRLGE
jgi:alcohol dehydrogenase class IV